MSVLGQSQKHRRFLCGNTDLPIGTDRDFQSIGKGVFSEIAMNRHRTPLHGNFRFANPIKEIVYTFPIYGEVDFSVGDKLTTVSTWHEEMILLVHTSYLFAQSRTGTYPPFWALGCSPMQEHIDKLEPTVLIPSASNLLFLPQTSHVLEVI